MRANIETNFFFSEQTVGSTSIQKKVPQTHFKVFPLEMGNMMAPPYDKKVAKSYTVDLFH